MMPLSERLQQWYDFDGAAYALGIVLGVFPDTPAGGWWLDSAPKWVFWTDNPWAIRFMTSWISSSPFAFLKRMSWNSTPGAALTPLRDGLIPRSDAP